MAAFTLSAVHRRILPAALAGILALSFFSACKNQSGDGSRQIEALKADLEEAQRRASAFQNSLAAKDAELAVVVSTLETTKGVLAEKEKALADREKDLGVAQLERDSLKKNEAFVFAEIAAAHQQGQTAIARARYEKFIADFPKSPLIAAASASIAQLSEAPREVERQMAIIDPKRKDREFLKTFNEGYMTLQELGPVLKKKSLTQVLALLGRPNQTFNSGTELGYANRAVNPATGTRGMLIIGFDDSVVSSLRVEYAGRKFVP